MYVEGGGVGYIMYNHCEFVGHNFVSGLRTLKPKNLENLKIEKPKILKTFSKKNLGFQRCLSNAQ